MGLGAVSAGAVAAKNAPIIAPIIAGALALHSDTLITIGAVVLGLVFGALWRTGSLISEGKTWGEIRIDWFVSLMIGGANAILTLALVDWLNLGLLFTMALGVVIGATGLRALPEIKDALMAAARRKLLSEGVAMVQPVDPALDEQVAALRRIPSPDDD